MTRVMVFGTYDLLHPGHFDLFRQAKQQGDELIVVVARDHNVMRMKGRQPKNSEEHRRREVEKAPHVDIAVLGHVDDPYQIIEEWHPDVLCLGYDQRSAFTEHLDEELVRRHLHPRLVRLEPFHPEIYKSSKMNNE
jgi:FAD synthetase